MTATPTDTALLLRACREHPDEDTPRVALADELTATGFEGAAEYIRADIEHCRGRFGKLTQRQSLRRRNRHHVEYGRWLKMILCDSDPDFLDVYYVLAEDSEGRFAWVTGQRRRAVLHVTRGLPETVKVTAPLLMDAAATLFLFPLTSCVVSDRSPVRAGDHYPDTWSWGCAIFPQRFNTWEESSMQIPGPLFNLLRKEENCRKGHYSRRNGATLALHTAALAFGRAAVK